MAMMMATLSLLLFLVIHSAVVATNSSLASSAAASYVRSTCNATSHPDACYNNLLPYADSFNGTITRVAHTSGDIAVARQHALSDELAHLKLHGTGVGRIADEALVDCSNWIAGDAMFANETQGHLDNLIAGMKSKGDFDSQ